MPTQEELQNQIEIWEELFKLVEDELSHLGKVEVILPYSLELSLMDRYTINRK